MIRHLQLAKDKLDSHLRNTKSSLKSRMERRPRLNLHETLRLVWFLAMVFLLWSNVMRLGLLLVLAPWVVRLGQPYLGRRSQMKVPDKAPGTPSDSSRGVSGE